MNSIDDETIEFDPSKYTILVIDDNPDNLGAVLHELQALGFKIMVARDGRSGLERARYVQPDLILLAAMVPGADGFEICRRLKEEHDVRDIPVIFMIALSQPEEKDKAFQCGAVDYVTKPVQHAEVLARISTQLRLRDLQQSLRENNWRLKKLSGDLAQANEAISNLYTFEKQRRAWAESLEQAGRILSSTLDMRTVPGLVIERLAPVVPFGRAAVMLRDGDVLKFIAQVGFPEDERSSEMSVPIREGDIFQSIAQSRKPLIVGDVMKTSTWHQVDWLPVHLSWLGVPLIVKDRVIGMISLTRSDKDAFSQEEATLVLAFAGQAAIALENARLYEEISLLNERLEKIVQQRTEELNQTYQALAEERNLLRTLLDNLPDAIYVKDTDSRILLANRAYAHLLGGSDPAEVIGKTDFDFFPAEQADVFYQDEKQVLDQGQPLTAREETILNRSTGAPIWSLTTKVPLHDSQGTTVGLVGISRNVTLLKQTQSKIQKLNTDLEKRLQRLSALRTIDMTITASHDLRFILHVLLEQTTLHLSVDGAAVLLLQPGSQTMEYAASRGFRTGALARFRIRMGEGLAGKVALERRPIYVEKMSERGGNTVVDHLSRMEEFVSYYGVPLVAKGQIKGVLEVLCRAPFHPEADWEGFLEALAGQAAIAIDNTSMFVELQRANVELTQAYDATITGWSSALDLRDRETEGHTLRVTEMTLRLAQMMGVPDNELIHIRRGGLLHDIGKMAIPDSILLKPSQLTKEEQAIMRLHPEHAYELLSPIQFLRPALAIPYYHHEKWDGTGYPKGLQEEQIPLAARIFAIVDVWDALSSDRPYRDAWPAEKVREHIRSLTGTHFDPQVVEAFLSLLAEDEMVKNM